MSSRTWSHSASSIRSGSLSFGSVNCRGVKSQQFDKEHVHRLFCGIMDSFVEEQCHAIVLGCTEIPLAIEETEYKGVPIINPLWIMARAMIQRADESKLKAL